MVGGRRDPLVAFRFRVLFDLIPLAGFSEVSGIGLETVFEDYHEGGLNDKLRKFPTHTRQTNLTLKRGVVDRLFYLWVFAQSRGFILRRNLTILGHDPSGHKVELIVHFFRVLPVRWNGPDFNANQESVAMETLELSHEGFAWLH